MAVKLLLEPGDGGCWIWLFDVYDEMVDLKILGVYDEMIALYI